MVDDFIRGGGAAPEIARVKVAAGNIARVRVTRRVIYPIHAIKLIAMMAEVVPPQKHLFKPSPHFTLSTLTSESLFKSNP